MKEKDQESIVSEADTQPPPYSNSRPPSFASAAQTWRVEAPTEEENANVSVPESSSASSEDHSFISFSDLSWNSSRRQNSQKKKKTVRIKKNENSESFIVHGTFPQLYSQPIQENEHEDDHIAPATRTSYDGDITNDVDYIPTNQRKFLPPWLDKNLVAVKVTLVATCVIVLVNMAFAGVLKEDLAGEYVDSSI